MVKELQAIFAVLAFGIILGAGPAWGQSSTTGDRLRARAAALEAKEERQDDPSTARGPKYTRAQEVAWHLAAGQEDWNRHDSEDAYAQWREVLRLDPGNADAIKAIRSSMVDGSRHVLRSFAQARGITAIAEALDDATDDQIAQKLIVQFWDGVQRVFTAGSSPDGGLYEDFQSYIDTNGLRPLALSAEQGDIVSYSPGRLHGRKLLESLGSWVPRIEASGVRVHITYPYNAENAADNIDACRFTVEPSGAVFIDGTDVGPAIPLEVIWEDGNFRIAPRPGYRLIYQFRLVSLHSIVRPKTTTVW